MQRHAARLRVPVRLFKSFLFDPVMAAKVLMGWELDTFQQVRLRIYWWTPFVIDSSGVSSGKTAVQFVYANLRAILIPDQVVGVYLPNFQVGKDEFWQLFYDTINRHPTFADQLVLDRGRLGERKGQGTWSMEYKCRSRLMLPAPGFLNDSRNQASRNFNTLIIDEYLRAMEMGEGVEKQLVDRARRASYNQHHPIWGNHIKFLGHAETPSHKGYRLVRAYKEERRNGSARYALVSFCYKDWSPEKAKKYLPREVIRQRKVTLTRDQFRRQWLGLWGSDGDGYYPEVFLNRCKRRDLRPLGGRAHADDFYFFGQDTAAGKGVKSDFSAIAVLRARKVRTAAEATFSFSGSHWHLSFVYSRAVRGRNARQLSGWFYHLHQRFGFSWGVMDPGGGGTWVYDAMQEEEQEIEGRAVRVVPVCTRDDQLQMAKQPIITWAKARSELAHIIAPQWLTGPEGLLDAMHRRYQEAWVAQQIHVPADPDDYSPAELKTMTPIELEALKGLERMRRELENVRVKVEKDGSKKTSAKGFSMFESRQKKDAAYTGLYAFHAFLVWLAGTWTDEEEGVEGDFVGV